MKEIKPSFPALVITVDTEEDNQWDSGNCKSVENIKYLSRFHLLTLKHKLRPTYLITYLVANDNNAAKIISEISLHDDSEIGAHLHPWTTPPHTPEDMEQNGPKPFMTEYSESIQAKKVKNLKKIIQNKIGINPTSFRAGRWGINNRSIALVEKSGFSVDSSVTPYINWKDTRGRTVFSGPNYTFSPHQPYYPLVGDIISDQDSIIEIPVTVCIGGLVRNPVIFRKFSTLLLKLRLSKILWLRPFPEFTSQDLISITEKAISRGDKLIHLMLHSSELMPGTSIYNKTIEDVDKIFEMLDDYFYFFTKKLNGIGITLSGAAKYYTR